MTADDSDDSLNLGSSKDRIADDGPATRRLSERREAGPSNVARSDTETDAIDYFPEVTKKPVSKVKAKIQYFESRNEAPKLQLNPSNPLKHIHPGKPKSKVGLFFPGKKERLADTRITRQRCACFPPILQFLRVGTKARGKKCIGYPSQNGYEAGKAP